MKILFISNFFPPFSRGGYEQWCEEIAIGLRKREHEVEVLTSLYRKKRTPYLEAEWIHRNLYLQMEINSSWNWLTFFLKQKQFESHNLFVLEGIIKSFKPDFVLVWGMWNLSWSLVEYAEKLMPEKVIYYIGDYWPTLPNQQIVYWKLPGKNWFSSLPKSILRSFALRELEREEKPTLKFTHALFPTEYMHTSLKQSGLISKETRIISGAIDTSLYASITHLSTKPTSENNISLLYAGRLTQEKGVKTAIAALITLVNEYGRKELGLTVVGSGDPEFEEHLFNLVQKEKVESYVQFLGSINKEEMPAFYHQADIFLFTSIWPEPFGRVIVEAMASGVAVIGAATGGASEILIDGVNSLTFQPGNSEQLAQKINLLIESPTLRQELAQNGKKMAVEKYDIKRMATEIEEYLTSI